MSLSKSQYIRGLQCHKSLWLYKHRKGLLEAPDASTQARFDSGTFIGELAQELFPDGKGVIFDYKNFSGMLQKTSEYLDQGVKTIYEATFSQLGVFIMADILHYGAEGWELYEVKASTSAKEYHRNDVAIQWYVLHKAGIKLAKAAVIHINNSYTREGPVDLQQLFSIEDITQDVIDRQVNIPINLSAMCDMLVENEPNIDIGVQCDSPYSCDFKSFCWKGVPEQSVFNLYRLGAKKKFELYNEGVKLLDDLPSDMALNKTQTLQKEANDSQSVIIDKDVIQRFIDSVEGPIYYLDFETFQDAVPRFDNQKPYQQIPFQYSLHIEKNGVFMHLEYLANEHIDPRRELAERLIEDLGQCGTIMAFNMSFEKSVITKLAEQFPDMSNELLRLNERFVDLIVPFRKGGYYDQGMNGSFSIKAILPTLFPNDTDLSYKNLAIQDGSGASDIYAGLHQNNDVAEVTKIREGLLAYCKLDTLAMVKIYGFLLAL